tara:strand:- start:1614 stop:1766 length:153 start_codon:yes stop_codon:yes gene_type:complete
LELEFWEERKMNSNADPNITLIKTEFEIMLERFSAGDSTGVAKQKQFRKP